MIKDTSIKGMVNSVVASQELYNKLKEKPDELVQKFYDLNEKKYTFWYKLCSRGKMDVNIKISEKVLRNRGLFKDYYLVVRENEEKEWAFFSALHDIEKEVKRYCENLKQSDKELKDVKYMNITKKEYKRIRDNQDLKYMGL